MLSIINLAKNPRKKSRKIKRRKSLSALLRRAKKRITNSPAEIRRLVNLQKAANKRRRVTRLSKNPSKFWRGFAVFKNNELVTILHHQKGSIGPKAMLAKMKKVYPPSEGYTFRRADARGKDDGLDATIRKVRKFKRNPPARKKHETIIVGYCKAVKRKFAFKHKGIRYYYTGTGFSRLRHDVKFFPGDAAKLEAKRILPRLPSQLYGIKVEKA